MMKWSMFVLFLFSSLAFANPMTDAFQDAVLKNDVSAVKALLAKGFDPNQNLNETGETPLTLVALNGRPEILEVITSGRKVDINHQTQQGWTALMFAARAQSFGHRGGVKTENKDYIKTVELLLRLGADRSIRDKHGEDALKIAKISHNRQIEKLLTAKSRVVSP